MLRDMSGAQTPLEAEAPNTVHQYASAASLALVGEVLSAPAASLADKLSVADAWDNNVEKITPDGVSSVFVTIPANHSCVPILRDGTAGNAQRFYRARRW